MQVITAFKKYMLLPIGVMAAFVLASCGSYDYVGYENDGIYGSTERSTVYTENEPVESNNYYANYFAEKSAQYESVPEENAIFIDIENYSSANSEFVEDDLYLETETTYNGGYGSWGDNADSVSINYFNNGFGGFYNPFFNRFGYGFGFYGNGFYNPVGFGFYSPFYGGFYNPYFYGGFYGGFYSPFYAYNPYFYGYNNFYGNPYVFHNGRRSAYTAYRAEVANERRNRSNRDSYSRSNNLRRNRSSAGYNRNSVNANRRGINRSNRTRATRSSGGSNRSIYRSNRSSNNRSYNSSGSRRSSSGVRRSSGSSRSSGVRSSSGGSRSSGVRRSGGGSRSSGSVRRSGGRGRG